ncbi:MAG: diguanylate cyclase [Planctomycetes bacterium]|nr:diguanylate cyclase [Planctomycetota bacterium]
MIALIAMAMLGFLIGRLVRLNRRYGKNKTTHEQNPAMAVAKELERIAQEIHETLSFHRESISDLRAEIDPLTKLNEATNWQRLSKDAEKMIKPTQRLARDIAHAYDEIRQQSNMLLALTENRTDPLTGMNNRRMLDEAMTSLFALMVRYGNQFALAIFDIDCFKNVNDQHGHVRGDQILQQFARALEDWARETDVIVRYGGDEFVVVMPETNLSKAWRFGERLRRRVEKEMSVTISGGVAVALETDSSQTLVERADKALYGAKTAGRNLMYLHDGTNICASDEAVPPENESDANGQDSKILPTVNIAPPASNLPIGTAG